MHPVRFVQREDSLLNIPEHWGSSCARLNPQSHTDMGVKLR